MQVLSPRPACCGSWLLNFYGIDFRERHDVCVSQLFDQMFENVHGTRAICEHEGLVTHDERYNGMLVGSSDLDIPSTD